MKIHNVNQSKVQNLESEKDISREDKVSSSSKPANKKDEKSLSKMAELVSKARLRAESAEDVREKRIREVEEKLKAGAYEQEKVKEELSRRLARHMKKLLGR